MGVGEVLSTGERAGGRRRSRAPAWRRSSLGPKEGLALLNGTQVSTALALAGLFEAERAFRAALVTGALATDAAKGSDAPFDPRIQELRGHRGQIEVAAAPARADAGQRHPRLASHERRPRAGPLLPALPAAGDGRRARPAAPGRRDAWRPRRTACPTTRSSSPRRGEVISGGNFHAEPVAFAADMIAMALCEIGSLAERRIAMLVDPALSGLPAFLTPKPGLNSGFMIAAGDRRRAGVGEQAARLSGKRRFDPDLRKPGGPRLDGDPRRAPAARHGARMPRTWSAIELLAAAQGCDFHAPLRSSAPLERARALLRGRGAVSWRTTAISRPTSRRADRPGRAPERSAAGGRRRSPARSLRTADRSRTKP